MVHWYAMYASSHELFFLNIGWHLSAIARTWVSSFPLRDVISSSFSTSNAPSGVRTSDPSSTHLAKHFRTKILLQLNFIDFQEFTFMLSVAGTVAPPPSFDCFMFFISSGVRPNWVAHVCMNAGVSPACLNYSLSKDSNLSKSMKLTQTTANAAATHKTSKVFMLMEMSITLCKIPNEFDCRNCDVSHIYTDNNSSLLCDFSNLKVKNLFRQKQTYYK